MCETHGETPGMFFFEVGSLVFFSIFQKKFCSRKRFAQKHGRDWVFWVPRHHIRVHGVFRSALKGSGINEGDGDFVEGSDVECSEWQSEERSEKNWGGVFKYFYGITPKIGEDSHFDSYFPRG